MENLQKTVAAASSCGSGIDAGEQGRQAGSRAKQS